MLVWKEGTQQNLLEMSLDYWNNSPCDFTLRNTLHETTSYSQSSANISSCQK